MENQVVVRLYLPYEVTLDVLTTIGILKKAKEKAWWQRKRMLTLFGVVSEKYFHIDPDTILSYSINDKLTKQKCKK